LVRFSEAAYCTLVQWPKGRPSPIVRDPACRRAMRKFGRVGVGDGDNLFRHSIYPVSFKGKSFAPEKLLRLVTEPDGSILTSVAWERYAPTAKYVHEYGCRTALRRNEKKRAGGKFKEKDRSVYCGAYHLKARTIRALVAAENLDEISSADIIHNIEEGEIAHADLRVVLKPGSDIEGTKTAIIDRLWNAGSGPLFHRCDCDRDIAQHPNHSLSTPPGGAYLDSRTSISRIWYLIRFGGCYLFWRIFCEKTIQ
jgi:hypothetical protein